MSAIGGEADIAVVGFNVWFCPIAKSLLGKLMLGYTQADDPGRFEAISLSSSGFADLTTFPRPLFSSGRSDLGSFCRIQLNNLPAEQLKRVK
jgi:hypothetical protein